MPFPEVGLWSDVPEADYHKLDAFSSSGIKAIRDCPAVYKWEKEHPELVFDTTATEFGTAAHKMILEESKFDAAYYITRPGFTRAKKEDKEWAAEREAQGKTQLKMNDYDLVRELRDAVYDHPFASLILSGASAREKTAIFDRYDLRCKARYDIDAVESCCLIADVKVTAYSHPDDWVSQCVRMNQIGQAAWYQDSYSLASREDDIAMPDFAWIVCPSERPFKGRIWVAIPSEEWCEMARIQNRDAADIYKKCVSENRWPGYADNDPKEIQPRWLEKRAASELIKIVK